MSPFFLGVAIQAFAVAILQAVGMIKVTTTQQLLAGVLFLGLAVIIR